LAPGALHVPAQLLAKQFSLSPRQLERRFLQAYGMSLRDYRRLVRFMTALLPMMTQQQRPGGLTRIAQDSGYTDQSHLIRDFHAFIGASPLQFLKAFHRPDSDVSFWKFSPAQLQSFLD
jgi:transcriptional regulator GlxA family with amidase domain